MRRSMSLVVGAVLLVGCGTAGPGATPTGGASAAATPVAPTPPPATPAASGSLPTFSGSAKVTLDLAGTVHTLEGGRCDVQEMPAEYGGGWVLGINIGTPSFGDGGPDYFGLVVDLAGSDPDGTYDDVLVTASVDGAGFNVGSVELTVEDDGGRGSFTGQSHGIGAVRGAFEC